MAYLIASKDPKIPQDRAFTRRAIVYNPVDAAIVKSALSRAYPHHDFTVIESTRHKISD